MKPIEQIREEALQAAEITFIAVSLSCSETGKHPLREAIQTYASHILSAIDERDEIEAMARAIFDADDSKPNDSEFDNPYVEIKFEELHRVFKDKYVRLSQAALKANLLRTILKGE